MKTIDELDVERNILAMVRRGHVLVVWAAGLKAAVQDADEPEL